MSRQPPPEETIAANAGDAAQGHSRTLASRLPPYADSMWDVLTWHDGTLAIAWWAVIVLIVALLSIGGASAARRR
jgi:hypothetical protein